MLTHTHTLGHTTHTVSDTPTTHFLTCRHSHTHTHTHTQGVDGNLVFYVSSWNDDWLNWWKQIFIVPRSRHASFTLEGFHTHTDTHTHTYTHTHSYTHHTHTPRNSRVCPNNGGKNYIDREKDEAEIVFNDRIWVSDSGGTGQDFIVIRVARVESVASLET